MRKARSNDSPSNELILLARIFRATNRIIQEAKDLEADRDKLQRVLSDRQLPHSRETV